MASNEADEALLNAINCPESYSEPIEVYEQAKRRGMRFVTITDHDSIAGVVPLLNRADVLVGEEVTCYFPEDRCKIHLLVWGLTQADHDAMQAVADDIYEVAAYVEEKQLAHSVAHPVYRQNDVLERWHLERLALLFKGFECLNGAHSALHREALEPFVDELTAERIEMLSRRHGIAPRWPETWIKARTGGSDDHGLFNVGRTWTEFPPEATSVPAILQCIREARCKPGGEAGSSMKLAHNFFGVGIRYYARQLSSPNSVPATMLGFLTGERQPRRKVAVALAKGWAAGMRRKVGRLVTRRKFAEAGTGLLADVVEKSIRNRLREVPVLREALKAGKAPLAEHSAMFDLVSAVNRDVAEGIRGFVAHAVENGEIASAFNAISAVAAHQFVMAPYYFALFHQNRERHVLSRVTGHKRQRPMRVAVFTDTLDEVNGVGRFLSTMAAEAHLKEAHLTIHTCSAATAREVPSRKNFAPLLTLPMPFYQGLSLNLPPALEVLEWADRQQFDAVHISTPGPMGLCGLLVAKMLRVPVIATFHTDFAQYVERLTGDYRLTSATAGYMAWFYAQASAVFARSRSSLKTLEGLGIDSAKLLLMPPSVDGENFSPTHRDADHWHNLGVNEPHRVLYVGRVSVEKNLPMLAEAFKKLCMVRRDVALVIAGDGPYLPQMRKALAGFPVHFLGFQEDAALRVLYASSDLLAFPSRTDTLGQAVMEAQASGLPVLVSGDGGPHEVVDDGLSGLVLSGTDSGQWSHAMQELLDDAPRRLRMSRTAPTRMARFAPALAFEAFWEAHVKAAASVNEKEAAETAAASDYTSEQEMHLRNTLAV
jgi:glycosyltransferase involved in cell wall biosynthesis